MIKFQEEGHIYTSVEPDDIKWLSITTLIGKLHEGFDPEEKAISSHNRKPTPAYPNKWYKVPVEEIRAAWKGEGERSIELGHWYHNKREQELYYNDQEVRVVQPIIFNNEKVAPDQILKDGIYPEHLVYLLSAQLCGQSDYVEVRDGKVYIRDYKTSKEIKRRGFTNYRGTKMMYSPIEHLEDCDYVHYNIQLSLYMYIILRHNPNLEFGSLTIEHIKFEQESQDKYGYPIYKRDEKGEFIIKEIEEISMQYLKKEVVAILDWLKYNIENLIEQ